MRWPWKRRQEEIITSFEVSERGELVRLKINVEWKDPREVIHSHEFRLSADAAARVSEDLLAAATSASTYPLRQEAERLMAKMDRLMSAVLWMSNRKDPEDRSHQPIHIPRKGDLYAQE